MSSSRLPLCARRAGAPWLGLRGFGVTFLTLVVIGSSGGCSERAATEAAATKPSPPAGTPERGAPPPAAPAAAPAASFSVEAMAANNRGVGLMGAFEFEAAQSAFEEALGMAPNWTEAAVNKAIALLNQSAEGRQEQALELLAVALATEPAHPRAAYAAGLCHLFLGDAAAALPRFAAVAAADPRDAYAAYYHGQCLELLGEGRSALGEYRRAAEADPYLRSAYLGMQRCLQREGDEAAAAEALDTFLRLAENPRASLAEFKYTRMGRKGEALAAPSIPVRAVAPQGPLTMPPTELAALPTGWTWSPGPTPRSITAADINGDGRLDLFIASALRGPQGVVASAVLLQQADGRFELSTDHPLAATALPRVESALWGDIDNDGRTDVVLCARGMTRVWINAESGWRDETIATEAIIGASAESGLLADVDHDGDLDLILWGVGPRGAAGRDARVLINLDGRRFRDLTASVIPAEIRVAQVVAGDFDGDRDLDLFLLGRGTNNVLLRNDRLWAWTPWVLPGDPSEVAAVAAAAGDVDGDGGIDLVLLAADGALRAWSWPQRGESPAARSWELLPLPAGTSAFALVDLHGDGVLRAVAPGHGGVDAAPQGWALPLLDALRGPSVVTMDAQGTPRIAAPGAGRLSFSSVEFRGRLDPGQSMRSNASGLGTLVNARVGDRWLTRAMLPTTSTPGQSLEPLALGLGGAPAIDFMFIDWSDGVFQSELNIAPGGPHRIVETQRQISSCPLLFAWDGRSHRFVSDLLGVGGLGYLIAPGEYAPPRPWEYFLLPEGLPAEREGALEILLHEPMEEAVYLDSVALHAIDLPEGWSLFLDERMGLAAPEPTGEVRFARVGHLPSRATVEAGNAVWECTEAIAAADFVAAPTGPVDGRYLGRLRDEHILTLEFAAPLNVPEGQRLALVAEGWVEYPYGQTNFAAWQSGAKFEAPTVEARRADGTWVPVLERFGYPAGMPRGMSVPLPALPPDCMALRLRSTLEIHWDQLSVLVEEPCPQAQRRELALRSAELRATGYPRRSDGPSRRPIYDYEDRTPLADMKIQPGWYTQLGPVEPLVSTEDGALAIFGPGEEIRLRFAPLPEPSPGLVRRFVLEVRGWCKDMDLFTADGETVEPIPGQRDEDAEALHRRLNTRFAGGR